MTDVAIIMICVVIFAIWTTILIVATFKNINKLPDFFDENQPTMFL